MVGKVWIFDLDDTLIPNHHDYSYVQIDYLRWMLGKVNPSSKDIRSEAQLNFTEWVIDNVGNRGPDAQSIINLQVGLEESLKPTHPDPVQNLSASFHNAYYEICKSMGIVPSGSDLEVASQFGNISECVYNEFDANFILNTQVEIDKKGAEKNGFGKDRFPTSFRIAYTQTLDSCGISHSEKDAEEAYRIGTTVFDKTRYETNGFLEGAEKTLDFLLGQGDRLVLITKGDSEIQKDKIDANQLQDWFGEDIYVVNKKNEWTIQSLTKGNLRDEDFDEIYHVGNSIRSDVYPALDSGIRSVYIPCETWAFERDHNGVPKDSRLIKLENIEDIIKNY